MIGNLGIFFLAAFFEIFGCFAFWLYFRLGKTPWWIVLGVISLILFAYVLTKIDVENAGRIYAIYGGIYIILLRYKKWESINSPIYNIST